MPFSNSPETVAQWLVSACASLGLGVVNAADDFFAVGGTSMLAIKLIARIEDTFGEDVLPPSDLFIIRNLNGVAQTIHGNLATVA